MGSIGISCVRDCSWKARLHLAQGNHWQKTHEQQKQRSEQPEASQQLQ
jgi:hypothetical protein